jgi:valyl-tRNA synthetase
MNTELPSKYDPSSVETQAYRVWLEEKCFHADPAKPGEPYSIVIPPPNVTGALHLGHAINATLQDILTRQHRMRGFNTVWIPGIDHAGIATQAVVEKQLKEKENKTRHDVGREGLVERIWAWKQQYGDRILEQLQRLGASCDWDRTRFTLDEMCARAVRETFFKLFKDGLIYRGKRLVNWDTFLQTSISDDEIYHEAVKTNLWHIRYPIEDGEATRGTGFQPVQDVPGVGEPPSSSPERTQHGLETRATFMTVATTRPETMLGDTAVAVHSEDPRWNWAIGKHVRLPLTGRLIPIIADDILVDPKFGTGVVKVTPAHDPNDYAVWQRHKGQADEIDLINILTPDGKITADRPEWSKYAGMKRDAARKQVVEDLKAAGLLEKEEPYETQVGHSDRSKTPIEPYLSDQWFVKMAPLAEPALQAVREGKIKFYPERHAQQYLSWLGEKRDWPVSRQLWWGHRIPVWIFRWNGPYADLPSDSQQVHLDLPYLSEEQNRQIAAQVIRPGGKGDIYIGLSVRPNHPEIERLIEKNGGRQDPDVLDTWFSSALWPHSTLGWPERTAELERYYPTSVLVTGRDIITLWVARMVMMGMYNMGEKAQSGEALSPSPSYSGEREGVRGGTSKTSASQSTITPGPSPQPSPPGTRERGQETQNAAASFTPSSGTPGEGRGGGLNTAPSQDPHPNPPPEYRERGQDSSRGTGGSPVSSELEMQNHGRAARATAKKLGLPFLDVAINPTILDGKGERMSKSKGNGVDPVDIIDSYGADALRFTLTKMATETQDARMPVKRDAQGRNTSDKFDEGRNFCNKLWNACRFALANLEGAPSEGVDEQKWSLADRWIVSRFNRTLEEANNALAAYRFDVYAKACYDFFWGDFCDWYVETIKPAMKDPARAGQTANVLASVLDGALRLMHPMIPFITETVWWRLNAVRPQRGLPGRLECPPSERLVLAPWPNVGDFSQAAEFLFPRLQEVIGAIRTLRNDYKVSPKQTVVVSIKAPGDSARQILANRETVELLATCTLKEVSPDLAPVPDAATAMAAGCEIFVEGLIDKNAEKQRMEKEAGDKKRSIEAMNARLSNEAYTAKAPPHLVQQTRDQLAAAEAELAKLEEALRKLG